MQGRANALPVLFKERSKTNELQYLWFIHNRMCHQEG